ncbi:hypothetical protein GW17_00031929 [Ensete ventricosum]|nr:hypothetical protein GW17_00031929 [Ensete ventricosum]
MPLTARQAAPLWFLSPRFSLGLDLVARRPRAPGTLGKRRVGRGGGAAGGGEVEEKEGMQGFPGPLPDLALLQSTMVAIERACSLIQVSSPGPHAYPYDLPCICMVLRFLICPWDLAFEASMHMNPAEAEKIINPLRQSSMPYQTCRFILGYWYVDRLLSSDTAKIDRRRSIEGEKGKKKKKKKRKRRKKKEKGRGEEERIPRAILARASSPPVGRRRPRPRVAREPSPPSLAIFLPRGEKDRPVCTMRTTRY